MCWPRVGEANPLFSVCITLCRWTATARLSMPLNDRGISDYWRGRFVSGNCHNLCHWTVSSEDSCTRCTNWVVGVDILFVHTTVLSLKTAFNLVKIHLLFRIMILIQWSVNISVFVNYVVIVFWGPNEGDRKRTYIPRLFSEYMLTFRVE